MNAVVMQLKTSAIPKEQNCDLLEKEIREKLNADAKTYSVKVKTLPIPIQKALDAIRMKARNHYLYPNSLPIKSADGHLVPAENLEKVVKGIEDCEKEWNKIITEVLIGDYENVKLLAENAACKEAGKKIDFIFPTLPEVERAFTWELTFRGMERFDIAEGIKKIVGDELEETITGQIEKRQAEVMRELAVAASVKIHDVIKNVFERLGHDKTFRDSLIPNVQDLIEVLPSLNMYNDSKVDEYYEDLKDTFKNLSSDQVREDKGLARQVASKTKDIIIKIAKDFPESKVEIPEELPPLKIVEENKKEQKRKKETKNLDKPIEIIEEKPEDKKENDSVSMDGNITISGSLI